MSDLAKMLRDTTYMYQADCELKMKCADRIEELEAKLTKAMQVIEAYEEDEGYVPRRVVSLYDELKGQNDLDQ